MGGHRGLALSLPVMLFLGLIVVAASACTGSPAMPASPSPQQPTTIPSDQTSGEIQRLRETVVAQQTTIARLEDELARLKASAAAASPAAAPPTTETLDAQAVRLALNAWVSRLNWKEQYGCEYCFIGSIEFATNVSLDDVVGKLGRERDAISVRWKEHELKGVAGAPGYWSGETELRRIDATARPSTLAASDITDGLSWKGSVELYFVRRDRISRSADAFPNPPTGAFSEWRDDHVRIKLTKKDTLWTIDMRGWLISTRSLPDPLVLDKPISTIPD